jgi:hypothetical protein
LGDPLIHDVFFGSHAIDSVTIEVAGTGERAIIEDIFLRTLRAGEILDGDLALLAEALRYAETRVRVAKTGDGVPVGFSAVVPVCRSSIGFLARHPRHARLLGAFVNAQKRAALPPSADRATAHYVLHVAATGDEADAVRSALLRELGAIFGLGGVYLCTSTVPLINRLLEACGFELLTESADGGMGWALDLTRMGFEGWIETIIEGHATSGRPDPSQLESEVLGAFAHWNDSEWLAMHCPILSAEAPLAERPAVVRNRIVDGLTHARASASNSGDRAFRALELGYMRRTASQKQAMQSLAVSRATFYRLCRRGVRTVVERLLERPETDGTFLRLI